MSVHVLKNFPPLAGLPLTNKQVMREVGLLARERVYRRTISGTDMHGQPFKAYSKDYLKAKQQAVGTTQVNLQLSGGMLNALQIINVTEDSVEIGFKA